MTGSSLYSALLGANIGAKPWPAADSPFGRGVIACLDAEIAKEPKGRAKKKPLIDERANNIFNIYPNRQGGVAALRAITESIAEDGFDLVLERTTIYANAVARWPRSYRYAQNFESKGKDMVPHASTWFNQRRYRDDPETWKRVGDAPPPPPKVNLPEPVHWRFKFPESRFVVENISWENIDEATQKWITEQMAQRRQQA